MTKHNLSLGTKINSWKNAWWICRQCGEKKALAFFPKKKRSLNGRFDICRECCKVRCKEYLSVEGNRDTNKASCRNWYRKNREYAKSKQRDYNYDLRPGQFDSMLKAQGGVCLICSRTRSKGPASGLVIDHCHESNVVRGLLCAACNTGLGMFEESIDRMLCAIEYLRRHHALRAANITPVSDKSAGCPAGSP